MYVMSLGVYLWLPGVLADPTERRKEQMNKNIPCTVFLITLPCLIVVLNCPIRTYVGRARGNVNWLVPAGNSTIISAPIFLAPIPPSTFPLPIPHYHLDWTTGILTVPLLCQLFTAKGLLFFTSHFCPLLSISSDIWSGTPHGTMINSWDTYLHVQNLRTRCLYLLSMKSAYWQTHKQDAFFLPVFYFF